MPETLVSAAPVEPAEDQDMQSEDGGPTTASFETDQEEGDGNNMEPVYNVTIIENGNRNDIHLEDDNTLWSPKDVQEQTCASFASEMPSQRLRRFLNRPGEHFPCLVAAAKRSKTEVVYSELAPQEKRAVCQSQRKRAKMLARHRYSKGHCPG